MNKRYALYFDLEMFVERYDLDEHKVRTTNKAYEALKFDSFEEANEVADKLGGNTMVIEVTNLEHPIDC
ncbi:hypothetical protein G6H35_000484 [Listeria monocytogenes]|nr:hypothetical protein [Listeria monocytogenes]